METALSTLSNLPEDKKQSIVFGNMLVDEVLAGVKDPLKVDIQLKILEDMIETVRKKIKEVVLKEADKYGEKIFEINGAKISVAGKTTYDYKACGYSKYNKIIEEKEKIETFLKALTDKIADIDTGEVILPPTKKYSPYLKIEL